MSERRGLDRPTKQEIQLRDRKEIYGESPLADSGRGRVRCGPRMIDKPRRYISAAELRDRHAARMREANRRVVSIRESMRRVWEDRKKSNG